MALGPLTNLALAIRLDPTFPQKLKDLFIMGGNMEGEKGIFLRTIMYRGGIQKLCSVVCYQSLSKYDSLNSPLSHKLACTSLDL